MIEPANAVLSKMLDRLFASMVNGPAMNCRPHASRQRVDMTQFGRLNDGDPGNILLSLVGPDRGVKLAGRVPAPAKPAPTRKPSEGEKQEELSPEEKAARLAWADQQSLLTKIRLIADDARTYEQDTGVHALNIGFPLLSLPPGTFGGRSGIASRRILAPIAFIPVTLTLKSGTRPLIEIACRGEGVDRVTPNIALLAWLEQQTGQPMPAPSSDEAGEEPWREIVELVRLIAKRAEVKAPELFASAEVPAGLTLASTPKADQDQSGPSIVTAAVLGLFPTANQGLLNDTREMVAAGAPDGPIESFVRHNVSLDVGQTKGDDAPAEGSVASSPALSVARAFSDERLITVADPCQTRAVRLARQSRGLVIHGPPGTGKSQTIANVIADHLARGERVLFVCDKRTALDVVADRLGSLGLGDLLAAVHDPQRDQREFYRSVREQLDKLPDTSLNPAAAKKLKKIDAELQRLHDELSAYYRELMGERGGPSSFHHLVGQWLAENGDGGDAVDWKSVQDVDTADFESHRTRLREVLQRGEAIGFATNPWRPAIGLDLGQFLANPMDRYRRAMGQCLSTATATDATYDAFHPAFSPDADLPNEARRRQRVADELKILQALPPASAQHWAQAKPNAVQFARAELSAAADWKTEIAAAPLDAALRQARPIVPPVQTLHAEREILQIYADAFARSAAEYRRVQSAAPACDEATILKWITADPKIIPGARKRLDAVAPLADAIEARGLDVSMLARFDAAPLDAGKMFDAMASLGAYLDTAAKWHAIFHFKKKKAAEPIVRHFGLSLTPASAAHVQQFLTDRQKRVDLRAAVESVSGKLFEDRLDEDELLGVFRRHRAAIAAFGADRPAGEIPPGPSDHALSQSAIAALNQFLGAKADGAAALLKVFDLPANDAAALHVIRFFKGLEARSRMAELLSALSLVPGLSVDAPDSEMLKPADLHERLFALMTVDPVGSSVGDAIAAALSDPVKSAGVIAALQRSPQRAAAIIKLDLALAESGIYSKTYLKAVGNSVRANKQVAPYFTLLIERLDTLEGVIRVIAGLAQLPRALSAAAGALLKDACESDAGFSAITRNVLAGEIVRRLADCPTLQTVDGHRLQTMFDRFSELSKTKKGVVRDLIQHHWVSRQKERLLATTGSRLNATGADLRRRLTTRGERAMRLRQVIAHGAGVDGGDPLFDLRPIWMASPETVAQLFPRQAIFDVVVFDEASQCRLEEALPVLTRAKRVVIAGDPKQLPPTRFFESAVVTSEDSDAEGEQELFDIQQGDVEDLLTAALGLDVEHCYLDVHYRSRNSDLIGFSNEHFYSSRLQAIPGHPKNRARYAPITVYRADGIYEKRKNAIEADRVCNIVRDLLKRAAPPSIGIACFNMVQRDLIVEKLEEMATADPEFAARLSDARERRGAGSSEGLFVKNLENVQGDERDHLIISTTYGPDPAGKFRRNFGPLGNAGGGRRLNVLITRARQELHIVTSIPRSVYVSLPQIPPGATPGGAWLLFSYLAYAEQLQKEYETNYRILENATRADRASVNAHPTRSPSQFARSLAARLAVTQRQGSEVDWGNEGFSIDLAMQHPHRVDDVTVGVLCDMTRYAGSDDPVEWDVFRTVVHESQGWTLHRVWTPHFFRDAGGSMKDIGTSIEAALRSEQKSTSTENSRGGREE
ncbi:MAG TPA: AAA domain-containing protein [Tepidisphaeraceae bacterium]|jgi:hypothetical protein|nr:AAA domain-containing protein [Tepidisphaeraceae bacterium]